jgi:hypothetical protein
LHVIYRIKSLNSDTLTIHFKNWISSYILLNKKKKKTGVILRTRGV